jgi:predicted enzyme related to lactoylglutathione lyase
MWEKTTMPIAVRFISTFKRGGRVLLVLLVAVAVSAVGCGSSPEPEYETSRPVCPVSPLPTEVWLPGKVVWVDLVTADLGDAIEFYSAVFGWKFVISKDGGFAEGSYYGELVGSIVELEEVDSGDARWLISISVLDVDAAAAEVERQGGEVLVGPKDLPNRGRYALIRDTQGAMCMLLRSTGGDPADEPADESGVHLGADHKWLWAELWTRDTDQAAAFYGSVVGYRSKTVTDQRGEPHLVLGQGGKIRAGMVKLHWEEVDPNWVPYLQVSDIGMVLAAVEEHGGSVVFVPKHNKFAALIADPTGGVLAIQQREVR